MEQQENEITLTRVSDAVKAMHGTMNALLQNMITGVTTGYEKGLEIVGVGYRFNVSGKKLTINAGYSHPVEMTIPEGLTVEAQSNTEITVKGIDKALVENLLLMFVKYVVLNHIKVKVYVIKMNILDVKKERKLLKLVGRREIYD